MTLPTPFSWIAAAPLVLSLACASGSPPGSGAPASSDTGAPAADSDLVAGLYAYMAEEGWLDGFEQARLQQEKAALELVARMTSQMRAQLGHIPSAYEAEFDATFERFTLQMMPTFTAEEVLQVYAAGLAEAFPGERAAAVIRKLESPLGQQLWGGLNTAMMRSSEFMAVRQEESVERATQLLTTELENLGRRIQMRTP